MPGSSAWDPIKISFCGYCNGTSACKWESDWVLGPVQTWESNKARKTIMTYLGVEQEWVTLYWHGARVVGIFPAFPLDGGARRANGQSWQALREGQSCGYTFAWVLDEHAIHDRIWSSWGW